MVLHESTPDTQTGAFVPSAVNNISLDGCSAKGGHERKGVAERVRRNGSRLLSIVGFQRNNGESSVSCV